MWDRFKKALKEVTTDVLPGLILVFTLVAIPLGGFAWISSKFEKQGDLISSLTKGQEMIIIGIAESKQDNKEALGKIEAILEKLNSTMSDSKSNNNSTELRLQALEKKVDTLDERYFTATRK